MTLLGKSMNISQDFGFVRRHKIDYNVETKRGLITLWSYYNGSTLGTDTGNIGEGFLAELISYQFKRDWTFGSNHHIAFTIGDSEDLLRLITALELAKVGTVYAFSNCDDRKVSTFFDYDEQGADGVIVVRVGSNERTGKITLGEAGILQNILYDILSKWDLRTM